MHMHAGPAVEPVPSPIHLIGAITSKPYINLHLSDSWIVYFTILCSEIITCYTIINYKMLLSQ